MVWGLGSYAKSHSSSGVSGQLKKTQHASIINLIHYLNLKPMYINVNLTQLYVYCQSMSIICKSLTIVCSNCNLLRSRKARHRVAQSGTQKWRGQVQPIGYRCYSPKPGAPRLSRVCKPQGWTCWEAHHAVEKALWGASEGLDSHKKNQKTQAIRGKII